MYQLWRILCRGFIKPDTFNACFSKLCASRFTFDTQKLCVKVQVYVSFFLSGNPACRWVR